MQHVFLPYIHLTRQALNFYSKFCLYGLDLKAILFTFYNAEKILRLAFEAFCSCDLQGIVQ